MNLLKVILEKDEQFPFVAQTALEYYPMRAYF